MRTSSPQARAHSVAVGSVPAGFRAAAIRAETPLPTIATRLQRHPAEGGASMFEEFHALADQNVVDCESRDPLRVRKAQLPGPLTLMRANEVTQQTSIRRLRDAIDTLLTLHPDLDEIWLDEPLLVDAPTDWFSLVGKCALALKTEYLDLRFGLHCCGSVAWRELLQLQGFARWAFDLQRDGDAVLAAWNEVQPAGELVWSLIPTLDEADDAALVERILSGRRAISQQGDAWITMTCGTGTLPISTALARFAQLERVRSAVDTELTR